GHLQQRSHLLCPLPPRASSRRAARERLCGIVLCLPGPIALQTISIPSIARRNPFTRAPDADARRAGSSIGMSWPRRIPLTGGWPAQLRLRPSVRLLAAQIGRLDDLRVAPDGVLLPEVEVVVGDLLEGRVFGSLVPNHLEPRLLEGGQVLVAPALDLHLVHLAHLGHDAE